MIRNLTSCTLVPLLSISLVAQPFFPVAAQAQARPLSADHILHDATPVKLRLSQNLSSADAKTGQEISFEVMDDIQVDGFTVLAKGASAIGVVTEAEAKRNMGRAGKLNISISYARLVDNEKAALRAVQESKGSSHTGAMTGAMVATSLILWPAAPFFLFIKGKDITIPQGTEITAFTDGDMHLDMSKFGAATPASAIAPMSMEGAMELSNDLNTAPPAPAFAPVSAPSAAAGTQASLAIDSTPPGADIEIDGAFVGNTPSTVTVASGSHQIAVKKKGFHDWTKTLSVTGGTVHLNAQLH